MNIETIKRLQARTSARRFRATCGGKNKYNGHPCGWIMKAKTADELARMIAAHEKYQAHA